MRWACEATAGISHRRVGWRLVVPVQRRSCRCARRGQACTAHSSAAGYARVRMRGLIVQEVTLDPAPHLPGGVRHHASATPLRAFVLWRRILTTRHDKKRAGAACALSCSAIGWRWLPAYEALRATAMGSLGIIRGRRHRAPVAGEVT